ncbi:MAG: ABC transporter ATP-binding protein [Ramlibacter sp.]|nr:ABC transporter ATP-binding protein [Ramlibacter sp.]
MIQLHNVVKRYPTRTGAAMVLNGIDLCVRPGEKLGILGRNGAGKSTLIRLLSGAERPTSGTIDREMSVSWPLAFAGGFQGSLTGLDNFRFICRVYGADATSRLPFVEEFSELGRYLREPLKTYSAGMRARLGFAISMSIEFDCYLIDEVIAVGDSRFHEKCEYELFQRRSDRAMILVSHMPDLLRKHCDAFGVLKGGKLHEFADADTAYAFYESPNP